MKIVLVLVLAIASIAAINIAHNSSWYAQRSTIEEPSAEYDVVIRRDSYGVPHILGETDADAAFGFAYAHAEDDFFTLQESLAASRGRAGELLGIDGAARDYAYHLLNVRADVEAGYESELSPETRALIEAYADGINLYAARHPEEFRLRGLFPVTGRDVAAGGAFNTPFFYGLDRTLGALASNEAPPRDSGPDTERGSNGIAIAPSRTDDGSTRLIVNSHQPWTGPVAWYEAHVTSRNGLDMIGGLFPGLPIPAVGHNRHLGWAATVNRPDLVDVYELTLDEDGENYRYGDEWRPLESRRIWLHVARGPFVIPIPRTVYRSVHGPVIVNDNGAFAIRYAGIGEIRAIEQFYRMARAQSFDEWVDVMRMQAIPSFNFIYADETGRIARLYNARFPGRVAGYDWRGILPGDDPRALWTGNAPFEDVPFLIDPPAGYVFDSNNTPCIATAPTNNLDCDSFSPLLGIETYTTNRMYRAAELLSALNRIGREELLTVKYDTGYSRQHRIGIFLQQVLDLDVRDDAELAEAQAMLARWDWNLDNRGPADTIAALLIRPIARQAYRNLDLPDPREELEAANAFLREHYGRLDPPLHDFLRLRRGDVDLPLTGGPDALRAIYWTETDGGQALASIGDSYIMDIWWDAGGRVHSESVHQFGAAVERPGSPHYNDQSRLFAAMRMKPTRFHAEDLAPDIVCTYRPGESCQR
ncbi:MAG: acylase [Sphingomonadaceae bacterium]|nr:acylase [Sphingomonadaceae bacterium]